MQEIFQRPMKSIQRVARITLTGATSGFVLTILMCIFASGERNASKSQGLLTIVLTWLGNPVGWAMEWAAKRNIVDRENVWLLLIIVFVYWTILSVISFSVGSYLWNWASRPAEEKAK